MHDLTKYLSHFFMGPYPDRTSAVLGVVSRNGERSMVVGLHGGCWWAKPWREENFHPEAWPDGFEFVDRVSAGIEKVKNMPSFRMTLEHDRLDTIRSLFGRRGREATTDDFDFANWLTEDDFDVKIPEKPEDVRMAANLAGPNDDIFFRILAQNPICPPSEQLLGDRRK